MAPTVTTPNLVAGLQAFNPNVFKALGHAQNRAARVTGAAEGGSAQSEANVPSSQIKSALGGNSGAPLRQRHAAAPLAPFQFRSIFAGSANVETTQASANLNALGDVQSQETPPMETPSGYKYRIFAKPLYRRNDTSEPSCFLSAAADAQTSPQFGTAEQIASEFPAPVEEGPQEPVTPTPAAGRKENEIANPVGEENSATYHNMDTSVHVSPVPHSTDSARSMSTSSLSFTTGGFVQPQPRSEESLEELSRQHHADSAENDRNSRPLQITSMQRKEGSVQLTATAAYDAPAGANWSAGPDAYDAEFSRLFTKMTEEYRKCQGELRTKACRIQELLQAVSAGETDFAELTKRQELLAATLAGRRRQEEMLRERITGLEEVVSWSQATIRSLVASLKDADDLEKLARTEIDACFKFRDEGIRNALEAVERANASREECKMLLDSATSEKAALVENEVEHLAEIARLKKEIADLKAEVQAKIKENDALACATVAQEEENQRKCRLLEEQLSHLRAQVGSVQEVYNAFKQSAAKDATESEAKYKAQLEKCTSRIGNLEKLLTDEAQAAVAAQGERDMLRQRLADLTSSLEEVRSQKRSKVRRLQSDCNHLIDEKKELLAQNAAADERIRYLTSELERVKATIPDPNMIAQLRADFDTTKERLEIVQLNETTVQGKLEETRILLFEQQAALSKSSEEVSKLRQKEDLYLDELKCVRQKMMDLVSETQVKVIESARKTREEMSKAYEELSRRQRDDSEKKLADEKRRGDRLESEVADLRHSVASLESEKAAADDRFRSLQRRADDWQLKANYMEELQATIAEREKECRNYELRIARLEADLEDLQNIRNANQESKARLEQVNSEKDVLSKSLALTRREYASKLSEMDKKLESMAKDLQNHIRDNDVLKRTNEQQERRIAEYEKEKSAQQRSTSRTETENTELRKQADNLRAQLSEMEANVSSMTATANGNEQRITALSSEVAMLTKQLHEANTARDVALTKTDGSTAAFRAELDTLRAQLCTAEAEHAKARAAFAQLHDANAALRAEADHLHSALATSLRGRFNSSRPTMFSNQFIGAGENTDRAIMASPRRSLSALAANEMNEESLEIISLAGDDDVTAPEVTVVATEAAKQPVVYAGKNALSDNCPRTDVKITIAQTQTSQSAFYVADPKDPRGAEFSNFSSVQRQLSSGKKARTAAAGDRYHGSREQQIGPRPKSEQTELQKSKIKEISKAKAAQEGGDTSRTHTAPGTPHTIVAYKALRFTSSDNLEGNHARSTSTQAPSEAKMVVQGERSGLDTLIPTSGPSGSVSDQTHREKVKGQPVNSSTVDELTLSQIKTPVRLTRGMKRRMDNARSVKRKRAQRPSGPDEVYT